MIDKNQAAGAYVVHGIAIEGVGDDAVITAALDTDIDGIVDTTVTDLNYGRIVEGVLDVNEDGVIETAFMTVDVDKDGVIDTVAYGIDFNQDGVLDVVNLEQTDILEDVASESGNLEASNDVEFV